MRPMKYLAILFLFPFSIWACSDSSDVNELVAYASILEPTPFPKQVEAIGIFIPSEIDKAHASLMNINYVNGDKLMLQTTISVSKASDWDLQTNPALDGYSISYFYLNLSQVNNIQITVYYHYPKTKDGSIAMCGPVRNHKLSDLMAVKPSKTN
ncbi:hypothetical protein D9981_08475 [Pseudoalteromonas phenolica O-BC30]|nr:hypothetical protein D9981_08475 [Pseudoalteromonas phenolica O-BC30]